jgi:hypothetical protein
MTLRFPLALVLKLPHDERIRLAKLALEAAATDDAAAYLARTRARLRAATPRSA